jgi:fibronectin type 3 domain-containing protein
LSWSASSGASSYNVKRSTTSGGPYTTIASPTTTGYTNTGLTNGTTYYYVVSAVNASGESANSSQVSATPQLGVPPVPANVVATGGNGQVGLSWSASSGATSYNVKRSTTSGGPYTTIASPTTTGYTNTGLTNGTTYYYVVSAVNTAGESANSSQVSATPELAVPPPPTNVTATAGNKQVGLSWSASTGATSYNVKRATKSGGPYTTIGSPTTTNYTNTGLTNGTTYYYVVSAVNSAGQSANSSQVSATPQVGVPPAPTNVTATAGNGQVGLSWSASSGATSYNVKRSTTNGGPYTTMASPTTTGYTNTGLTNGTTYYYVVSAVNTAGESANSSQVSATPTASTAVINYGSGFTASGLQLNGSTTLNGTRLRLTDGGGFEASTAFYTTPVNVQSFTTNFSLQMTSATADGMAFVIQNGAATSLGLGGGNLGYGGIGNSVAVKFDIFSNAGEGTDSTGMYVNGATPTVPAVDMTSSGVSLLSGDVMNVQLSYNGTTLTLTIQDATTLKSFTTSWTVNIPTTVGSTTALVGFTAGTGGLTAVQDVLSWTYSN